MAVVVFVNPESALSIVVKFDDVPLVRVFVLLADAVQAGADLLIPVVRAE